MQKKSPVRCAFISAQALVGLLICAAACAIAARTLPAFLRNEDQTDVSQRTLTFAERVAYQHAIEHVYWRHRIWPRNRGERPDPKPSLAAVMSQMQLEKKVADYLRKSQALEDYWQRPITAEQLQAEMDRMARHTRQPEVLRDLFEALGNDPFIIAECLARPALADRLLNSWYAYDERIHGELKQRAQAELLMNPAVEQMKQLSGSYSEIDVVKSNGGKHQDRRRSQGDIKLNGHEWDETVRKLAATFNEPGSRLLKGRDRSMSRTLDRVEASQTLPVGKLSPLHEDQTRYYATAVLGKTNDRLRLAAISWLKEPLESWLEKPENHLARAVTAPDASYALPNIPAGGCANDTWTATSGPPDGREGHTAVWTGTEMIIWGGEIYPITIYGTGSRYNPSTDTWTPTSMANAPGPRTLHTAVWTGSEMVIWGGLGDNGVRPSTGGKYDPGTNSWIATSTVNAPEVRDSHTAIWDGNDMIVWGGLGQVGYLNTGGKYSPSTDSWTPVSTTNAPSERYHHTAIWTGGEMIVWGGSGGIDNLNTGGKYNPGTNSWSATSTINAPDPRENHSGVWTGTEMIIWGGRGNFNTGGRYNPNTNSWTATSINGAPVARDLHTAVWTGNQMIVWGGENDPSCCSDTGEDIVLRRIVGVLPALPTYQPCGDRTRLFGPEPR